MKRLTNGSTIWGLFLVLLGLGFLLDSLNVMHFSNFLERWWPSFFIILAILHLIDNRVRSALLWGALGVVLLLSTNHLLGVSFWSVFWPVIIIFVGLNFLLGPSLRLGLDGRDELNLIAIFGGSEKVAQSKTFIGANILAIFGGTKLDLRKASLSEAGAKISVLTLFGGSEIIVPDNMPVKLDVFALFGGSDDKRKDLDQVDHKTELIIQGIVLFGGVEVKN